MGIMENLPKVEQIKLYDLDTTLIPTYRGAYEICKYEYIDWLHSKGDVLLEVVCVDGLVFIVREK